MLSKDKLGEYIKLIQEADDAYHNKKNSIMTDEKYDLIKDTVLKSLPPSHYLVSKIGHAVCSNWPKEIHDIFMGSQDKVSNVDEIKEWMEKIYKFLGTRNVEFVLQHKVDGFSLEGKYRDGEISKAVTRGDGDIGEDITPNAMLFRYVPTKVVVKNEFAIRGEGVLYNEDYDTIQSLTKGKYKNPRNAASGISRRYDGFNSKYVKLITYDITGKMESETHKIETLKKLGFCTVPTRICKSEKDVVDSYLEYKDGKREKLPNVIDGLVLKVNNISLQSKLGVKDNKPNFSVALKFNSDRAITTVIDIPPQVGRTGKITPVAFLKPVDLMGSTITKASLHNYSLIKELGIGIGAEVIIEKKGDIIPQVVDIITPGNPFVNPTECPSCGGPLHDDSVNLWCLNKNCKYKDIARITYWLEVLDIKGFSDKFIDKLWDNEKISSVADLYKLTASDLENMEGIGAKTIKGFFKALKDTSDIYLSRFITALGIPSCSKSTAEVLVQNFKTWDKIRTLQPFEIETLYGFAETSAKSICEGIKEIKEMADELLEVIKIKEVKEGVLKGKSFCITGSLSSMGRKSAEKLIVENGGIFKSSVIEGLTYLVSNNKDSGSSKSRKAEQYGVKVIDEKEFIEIFGDAVEIKKESTGSKLEAENIFE